MTTSLSFSSQHSQLKMKREGRQHGMVRTFPCLPAPRNPQPKPKNLGGPSSTGPFTRVTTKPTNHSKSNAGKCGRAMWSECHISPTSKPKDKAKGAQRLRWSSDVDATTGVKLSGFSATNALNHLDQQDDFMDNYDDEEYNDHEIEEKSF